MDKKIKFLVMDVDGTLTDGKIHMGNDGELFKTFDIKDGCGINNLLPKASITPVIITGRKSKILENRCREIGIGELYQGIRDKREKLYEIIDRFKDCDISTVAYIGDDINDLQVMEEVKLKGGVVGCPNDAVDDVKKVADYICNKNGGNGAVREFIEWIIK